tara:strand:+ start:16664 stop:17446 length:783 start_codon:yes stop_codon:yes gene_type:complete
MISPKLSLAILALVGVSCQNAPQPASQKSVTEPTPIVTENPMNNGYELMAQKCFICHFEKMDTAKKAKMIAPPMVRVQEHYKPNYATKEAFVAAVTEWVSHPNVEQTLMPGAVRKFDVMPLLMYDKTDIELIAATLFDMDFGDLPTMNMHGGVKLNKGAKWKVSANTVARMDAVIKELTVFESNELAGYHQLGKSVFDEAKMILLEDNYSDELFNELHYFFGGVEGNMHLLVSAKSVEDAKIQQKILHQKFNEFHSYFEE